MAATLGKRAGSWLALVLALATFGALPGSMSRAAAAPPTAAHSVGHHLQRHGQHLRGDGARPKSGFHRGLYWDGNWMISPISVRVGGFTAEIGATLRMDEIHRFNEGLKYINQNLDGAAVLASMELWIELAVRCEPNGHLSVVGEVTENPATETCFDFRSTISIRPCCPVGSLHTRCH